MINPNDRLTIFHFDGAAYTDHTRKGGNFGRDSFSLTLETDDFLYIGYSKPINAVYINFITANLNSGNLSLEYYNGTSWAAVSGFDEDTDGLSRSAFLQWERDLDGDTDSQPDLSMPLKNYYRLSIDADSSAIEIQGMNLIFADDEDLKKEFFCITDGEILQGADSHILIHDACKNEIIQYLRNKGFSKQRDSSLIGREDIIGWDLLDIHEVREAAKFLALNKIFFNMSDSPDDVWYQKSIYYRAQYESQIQITLATIDEDNDGEIDDAERKRRIKHNRMTR